MYKIGSAIFTEVGPVNDFTGLSKSKVLIFFSTTCILIWPLFGCSTQAVLMTGIGREHLSAVMPLLTDLHIVKEA